MIETKVAPHRRGYDKPHDVAWIKYNHFCRYCGAKDVWREAMDRLDYYMGYSTHCFTCNAHDDTHDEAPEPPKKAPWWDNE